MKRSRFTQEQIIGVLKEHQTGATAADLCRKYASATRHSKRGGRNTAGWMYRTLAS